MPDAVSRWPRLVLTEPIRRGLSECLWRPMASPRARASIGSPTGVPVPWASM